MKKNWREFLYNFFAFKPIQTVIMIVWCASGIKLASMIGKFFGLRIDIKDKNNS